MKRTVAAAVLGTIAACSALFAISGPAYAVSCSATKVAVVVQFPDRTEVRCTSGDPVDGFDALEQAGFTPRRVQPFPGALCSIDAYPTKECAAMPPANAYWTYFHASAGGSWEPSNVGAGSWNPKPGSVEGWRFGDGAKPDTEPPGAAAPSPTSAPTKKPTAKPTRAPGGTSSTPTASDATATATPDTSPSANASDLPLTASPSDSAATPAAEPTDPAQAGGPAEASAEDAESSGGLSWVWGLVLLGVLAAAGGGTVLVRRRG